MAAGTVRKRQTKGGTRWQAIVDLGADPTTGRRRQRSRFCDTEREAKKALAKLQTEADAGLLAQRSAQTIGDLCRHWLDTHARFKAPRTYEYYEGLVRLHIVPHLGPIKAHALSPAQVRGWMAARLAAGAGARTVRAALACLRTVLDQAASDRVLATNAAAGIRVPVPGARDWGHERHTWTAEEARRFLDVHMAPEGAPYGPIWLVSLATGMRLGELLGLRWSDVDLAAHALHVRHALIEGRTGCAIGPLKSKSAKRDILIPPPVVAGLRTWRAEQGTRRLRLGAAWTDHDLVFCSATGRPLNRGNIWRHYRRLVRDARVPPIRIHDHRHTHITWALEEHADIKAVAARVGHSNTRITSEIYQRVTDQLARDVVDKTAAKLFPAPSPADAPTAPESAATPRIHRVLRPHLRPRRRARGA
jgi:integrase